MSLFHKGKRTMRGLLGEWTLYDAFPDRHQAAALAAAIRSGQVFGVSFPARVKRRAGQRLAYEVEYFAPSSRQPNVTATDAPLTGPQRKLQGTSKVGGYPLLLEPTKSGRLEIEGWSYGVPLGKMVGTHAVARDADIPYPAPGVHPIGSYPPLIAPKGNPPLLVLGNPIAATPNPRRRKWKFKPGQMYQGLHLQYLPANMAWAVMWHQQILRIFNTREEAEYEMENLLRKGNPRMQRRNPIVIDPGIMPGDKPKEFTSRGGMIVRSRGEQAGQPVAIEGWDYGKPLGTFVGTHAIAYDLDRPYPKTGYYRGHGRWGGPDDPTAVPQGNPTRMRRGAPCPPGVPKWMWRDPAFQAELRAYRRRHGRGPVEIRRIKVPKGFPKYMSVYGTADHAVYDAPRHSIKGKRIHHFGRRGRHKPWLVSSVQAGPKFLAFVGGSFKAKPDWIYD